MGIGRCEADSGSGGRRSALIFDETNVLFANVVYDPNRKCCVLSGGLCTPMVFSGRFDQHALSVTSNAQEPMAYTEPCQTVFAPHIPHVKVRVLSGVDVSLVICGLF